MLDNVFVFHKLTVPVPVYHVPVYPLSGYCCHDIKNAMSIPIPTTRAPNPRPYLSKKYPLSPGNSFLASSVLFHHVRYMYSRKLSLNTTNPPKAVNTSPAIRRKNWYVLIYGTRIRVRQKCLPINSLILETGHIF